MLEPLLDSNQPKDWECDEKPPQVNISGNINSQIDAKISPEVI